MIKKFLILLLLTSNCFICSQDNTNTNNSVNPAGNEVSIPIPTSSPTPAWTGPQPENPNVSISNSEAPRHLGRGGGDNCNKCMKTISCCMGCTLLTLGILTGFAFVGMAGHCDTHEVVSLNTCCPDGIGGTPDNINITSFTLYNDATRVNITGECGGVGIFKDFPFCTKGPCTRNSDFLRALLRDCENQLPCTRPGGLPPHRLCDFLQYNRISARCRPSQQNSIQKSNSARGQMSRYRGR